MTAKKLTRQEIKEDKLLTTMLEGYKYTQRHSSSVIVTGVIVVVIAAAVWGFFSYRNAREQRALNTLGIAELAYRTQNIAEATDSLKSLTEHYASTKAGREGWFALGHLYYIQGMYDEAIAAEDFREACAKLVNDLKSRRKKLQRKLGKVRADFIDHAPALKIILRREKCGTFCREFHLTDLESFRIQQKFARFVRKYKISLVSNRHKSLRF